MPRHLLLTTLGLFAAPSVGAPFAQSLWNSFAGANQQPDAIPALPDVPGAPAPTLNQGDPPVSQVPPQAQRGQQGAAGGNSNEWVWHEPSKSYIRRGTPLPGKPTLGMPAAAGQPPPTQSIPPRIQDNSQWVWDSTTNSYIRRAYQPQPQNPARPIAQPQPETQWYFDSALGKYVQKVVQKPRPSPTRRPWSPKYDPRSGQFVRIPAENRVNVFSQSLEGSKDKQETSKVLTKPKAAQPSRLETKKEKKKEKKEEARDEPEESNDDTDVKFDKASAIHSAHPLSHLIHNVSLGCFDLHKLRSQVEALVFQMFSELGAKKVAANTAIKSASVQTKKVPAKTKHSLLKILVDTLDDARTLADSESTEHTKESEKEDEKKVESKKEEDPEAVADEALNVAIKAVAKVFEHLVEEVTQRAKEDSKNDGEESTRVENESEGTSKPEAEAEITNITTETKDNENAPKPSKTLRTKKYSFDSSATSKANLSPHERKQEFWRHFREELDKLENTEALGDNKAKLEAEDRFWLVMMSELMNMANEDRPFWIELKREISKIKLGDKAIGESLEKMIPT